MTSIVLRRTQAVLTGVLALVLLGVGAARAQVVNESFEEDGVFSLNGWQTTDASCLESATGAPPGGGAWALKLQRRNLQGGCFGVVYQVIPEAQHGQVWRVRAWVRLSEGRDGTAQLYWTNFAKADPSGVLPYRPAPLGAVATTTSDRWSLLIRTDTLVVAPGDSIGIVLDAGVTSGPSTEDDFAYFDLVSLDQPGDPDTPADADEQPESPAFGLAHNYPNPFQTETTISFSLNRAEFVTLEIYDLLGRKVSTLVSESLPVGPHAARWEADDLPDGLYVARLRAGAHSRTMKLVRLR